MGRRFYPPMVSLREQSIFLGPHTQSQGHRKSETFKSHLKRKSLSGACHMGTHKHLLQLADSTIHIKDNLGYKTHIGKVKSHTGVTYNDEADTPARNVVEGHKTPDIIFTDAYPLVGGLMTWPQTRKHGKDTPPIITELADLHSSIRKLIRTRTSNTTTNHVTIYIQILHEARTTGSDHTRHAYSIAPLFSG